MSNSEFVENRVKIDFHRAFGDSKLRCNVAVAKALPNEIDQLALAGRQRRRAREPLLHAARPLCDFRIDELFALFNLLHAVEQQPWIGRFENDPLGPELVGGKKLVIIHPGGEEDHCGSASAGAKLAKHIDPAAVGHVDVEQKEVGL